MRSPCLPLTPTASCDQGKYGEAEPLYQRSLAIDTKVYGHDHQKVAEDLKNLAKLLESQVRLFETQRMTRSAVMSSISSKLILV